MKKKYCVVRSYDNLLDGYYSTLSQAVKAAKKREGEGWTIYAGEEIYSKEGIRLF
jgi:hypothetical protein